MRKLVLMVAMGAVLAGGVVHEAQAVWPVVDVKALVQLRQQVSYWRQQLSSMQRELTQLQATHAALTGGRGMQALLPVAPAARNYLPTEWQSLAAGLGNASAQYQALARSVTREIEALAVLPAARLAGLAPGERAAIEGARAQAAQQAVLTREAYARASERFASLQQLITAIGQAPDAKASADLQARIGAEQALLANEQAKLEVLAQISSAEQAVAAERLREQALAGHGQFGQRFQPVP